MTDAERDHEAALDLGQMLRQKLTRTANLDFGAALQAMRSCWRARVRSSRLAL